MTELQIKRARKLGRKLHDALYQIMIQERDVAEASFFEAEDCLRITLPDQSVVTETIHNLRRKLYPVVF